AIAYLDAGNTSSMESISAFDYNTGGGGIVDSTEELWNREANFSPYTAVWRGVFDVGTQMVHLAPKVLMKMDEYGNAIGYSGTRVTKGVNGYAGLPGYL